jgi:hypothetical protein
LQNANWRWKRAETDRKNELADRRSNSLQQLENESILQFAIRKFAICNFGTAPNLGIHGMILSRLNLQAAVVGGTIGQSKISKRGIIAPPVRCS